jgi:hypothetical protein
MIVLSCPCHPERSEGSPAWQVHHGRDPSLRSERVNFLISTLDSARQTRLFRRFSQ